MRFFLLTLSGLGILGGLSAQQPEMKTWSLDECVNYALENNLQVLTAAKQAAISKNSLEASQWNYAPSLNANSNAGWNFGFNIDPVTNLPSQSRRFTSTLGLSSTWVPFEGGRKYNSIAQQNHQYLAALYDLEDAKNDISLNVASAYLQILLNREILAVAQEQEKISSLQVERTQKLVEAGSAPKGDLLQLQAQLARDEQNRVNSENTLMISRLQLASLLQLSNPDDFRVNDPDLEVPEAAVLVYPPGKVYETALENQPNVKAARERIMSSEEAVDIARGPIGLPLVCRGRSH
ncbi:MAG: TolC family protein [Owenweeksia sp.]|nr:TolC family protein [Owenweeksia sp.]